MSHRFAPAWLTALPFKFRKKKKMATDILTRRIEAAVEFGTALDNAIAKARSAGMESSHIADILERSSENQRMIAAVTWRHPSL
jgi:hypothetical protein